jgi:hypothetical protein
MTVLVTRWLLIVTALKGKDYLLSLFLHILSAPGKSGKRTELFIASFKPVVAKLLPYFTILEVNKALLII